MKRLSVISLLMFLNLGIIVSSQQDYISLVYTVNASFKCVPKSRYSAIIVTSESQPHGCEVTENQSCTRQLEEHKELLKSDEKLDNNSNICRMYLFNPTLVYSVCFRLPDWYGCKNFTDITGISMAVSPLPEPPTEEPHTTKCSADDGYIGVIVFLSVLVCVLLVVLILVSYYFYKHCRSKHEMNINTTRPGSNDNELNPNEAMMQNNNNTSSNTNDMQSDIILNNNLENKLDGQYQTKCLKKAADSRYICQAEESSNA